MNDTDKQRLNEHNARVRKAAKKLPTKGLQDSFLAIGLSADYRSNDKGCTTHGISMEGISAMSRRRKCYRSRSTLIRDLKILEEYGFAVVESGQYGSDGKQETNTILLFFDEDMPADYCKPKSDTYRQPKPKHSIPDAPEHCPACLAGWEVNPATGMMPDEAYDAHHNATWRLTSLHRFDTR